MICSCVSVLIYSPCLCPVTYSCLTVLLHSPALVSYKIIISNFNVLLHSHVSEVHHVLLSYSPANAIISNVSVMFYSSLSQSTLLSVSCHILMCQCPVVSSHVTVSVIFSCVRVLTIPPESLVSALLYIFSRVRVRS